MLSTKDYAFNRTFKDLFDVQAFLELINKHHTEELTYIFEKNAQDKFKEISLQLLERLVHAG